MGICSLHAEQVGQTGVTSPLHSLTSRRADRLPFPPGDRAENRERLRRLVRACFKNIFRVRARVPQGLQPASFHRYRLG